MIIKFIRFLKFISTPGAIIAYLNWSKFSLASYQIIARAKAKGVTPQAVIDVGANVGQFSVAASKLFELDNIFPIEPDPRVAKKLSKNVGPKITRNVHICAIGAAVGEVDFHVNADSQVSSMLPLGVDRIKGYPASRIIEKITVPLTTLDALFANEALPKPILLKIDVQGFEDQVILGAKGLLTKVKWVLIEVSFARLYEGEFGFNEINELMGLNGFRFIAPLNFHVSPVTREIIEMDALFESIYQ